MRCPAPPTYEVSHLKRLPHELYHHHVLPTLLSEHLHQILVFQVEPKWHSFYTLPLVSRAFYKSYRSLCDSIFGLVNNEGLESIPRIWDLAVYQWKLATAIIPPCPPGKEGEITYKNFMSSESLIQVYFCAAIAESFFQADVIIPMLKNRDNLGADDAEDQEEEFNVHNTALNTGFQMRRFKMKDHQFHRLYRPFTCAMQLCDTVKPASLAHVAAKYLAEQVPVYGNIPMILKNSQDLEMYIVRPYNLHMSVWIQWAQCTLGLLEDSGYLVDDMQGEGKLVQSFKEDRQLPGRMIRYTQIIDVLDKAANTDWGDATQEIQDWASSLLVKFEDMMQEETVCASS